MKSRKALARPRPAERGALVAAVHQVLATLGYGDAIGNEVLGIQRVLRAAGRGQATLKDCFAAAP